MKREKKNSKENFRTSRIGWIPIPWFETYKLPSSQFWKNVKTFSSRKPKHLDRFPHQHHRSFWKRSLTFSFLERSSHIPLFSINSHGDYYYNIRLHHVFFGSFPTCVLAPSKSPIQFFLSLRDVCGLWQKWRTCT